MTNQIDRKTELQNITFMKCVLMLCVVLGHAFIFWRGGWFAVLTPARESPALGILAEYFGFFPIYGFVLASGYLYAYVRFERGSYTKFWSFVGNKALRLLVPYAFVLCAWVFPIAQAFFHYDAKTILQNFVLGKSPAQLWFLPMLFLVFVIVYPLSKLFQKRFWIGLAVVLVAYGIGVLAPVPNIFQIKRALQFLPMFWIGMQLRQKPCTLIKKIHPLIWVGAHLLLFVVYLVLPNNGIIQKLLFMGTEFVLHMTGAIMAFSLLEWIGSSCKWQESKVFHFLSARAMGIYLFHQQLIYVLLYLLNGRVSPYLLSPILFFGSAAGAAGITSLFLLTPVTRILIGEKAKK